MYINRLQESSFEQVMFTLTKIEFVYGVALAQSVAQLVARLKTKRESWIELLVDAKICLRVSTSF